MDREVPIPSLDVTLQRVGQEAILHDHRSGNAHVINESAARIWELCDGKTSLAQIISAFAASYNVAAHQVQDDVIYILGRFRELRMIE